MITKVKTAKSEVKNFKGLIVLDLFPLGLNTYLIYPWRLFLLFSLTCPKFLPLLSNRHFYSNKKKVQYSTLIGRWKRLEIKMVKGKI